MACPGLVVSSRRLVTRTLATLLIVVGLAARAQAWPASLTQCLLRDARRAVPRSLGRLLLDREEGVIEESRRLPVELARALAQDLQAGRLQPETLAALEAHAGGALDLIRQRRVSDGLVRLGGLARIPADLADPVLSAGPEGFAPGVAREYYAFVEANLDKIPVVLDDAAALELKQADLAGYWQTLLTRSRAQAPVIATGMLQNGRAINHTLIDFRSPVFGVASLSYSRAVTAIAATWLALWREVKGDLTARPQPLVLAPRDGAGNPLARPTPRLALEARRP